MTPPNSGEAGEEPAGKPLWGGRFAAGPAPAVMALSTSLDFDRRLWPQDIRATSAHARALERAGILEEEERRSIELALHEAAARLESGEFVFDGADEDIHSALERFLVARLGESGAKIHAGRSRNDLVVTDLRLWLKGEIPRTARGIYELEEALYRQARAHRETVGPGYTYLQRAQPIVLAHHLLAHAFALARDFERFTGAYRRADVSPLG
ncbi:MAG: lyase family protein, partial [Acidimicrobiales bacterium]